MQDSAPNRLKSWFRNYVSSFYTGNEEFDRVIQLKETQRCLRKPAGLTLLAKFNRAGFNYLAPE